jgi:hypothetical protein
MSYAKKYYRKDGRCIMRTSDVKYTEIEVPESPKEKLPLIIRALILQDKDQVDKLVKDMEETDEDMFEQYMFSFIGRVDVDIKAPMSEKQIKRELMNMQNIQSKFSTTKL